MANLQTYELKKVKSEFKKINITSSQASADYIRNFYHDDIGIYESFFLLLLNRANQTIGYVKISQGGISGTVVDIKLIAKYVTDSLASSVILCHNHPSGALVPSVQDREITEKIKTALGYFDTRVLDHIILTETEYYSFSDEGII